MQKYTIFDFQQDFPTDEACLDWLRDFLYPDGIHCKQCDAITKHHRIKSRMSYSCDRCGHHEHPMANTIFMDTRTPLRIWFHAVFLMASTRCGISGKQLQRETGVGYKTAWRMFHKIRSLLAEDDGPVSGEVEMDETYVGGKRRRMGRGYVDNKVAVFGIVERKGRVKATAVPDATAKSLYPIIGHRVLPNTAILTDEAPVYKKLPSRGYEHKRIHHAAKVYVRGNVHTNTIDGFWSLVKNGLRGVYHSVSADHLQDYLNEYAFRYNHRSDETPMFRTMLSQVEKA